MSRYFLAFAATVALVGTADPNQAKEEKLSGTWVITSAEIMGKVIPSPDGSSTYIFSKDNKLVMQEKGKTITEGTFKVDAGKTPKQIDLTTKEPKGKEEVMQCIYELNGDSLKLAYSLKGPEGKRPSAFDSKEAVVMTLKRQKP